MDLDHIDRTLARFRGAVATVSANLVDLESDGERLRLDQATLAGTTASRWSEARLALGRLWQWFTLLSEVFERADQLRAKKGRVDEERLSQLASLLNAPSIELSTSDVPPAERGLLGARQATTRCTPDELLARMTSAFADVVAVICAAGRAWAAQEARLQALDAQLAQTARLASTLGAQHTAGLDRLRARLGRLGATVASDPLSVDIDDFEPLEVSVRSVGQDIEEMAALRDGLAARMAQARTLLDDLSRTVEAGTDAHRETISKIAAPDAPAPLPPQPGLERELDRATAAAASGDWRAAGRLLAEWTSRVTALRADALRVLEANQAPLRLRNELRGRLDAYRSKAFRLGLLENRTVAGLYERARRELYTAPTDLAGAADLVGRYQQALAAPAHNEVPHEM